jgi:hypothetical protein
MCVLCTKTSAGQRCVELERVLKVTENRKFICARTQHLVTNPPSRWSIKTILLLCLVALAPALLSAQERPDHPYQEEDDHDLTAGRQVYKAIGPGLRALREGPDGMVYLLVSPQPGLLVFGPDLKPYMQIGAALSQFAGVKTRPAALVYGEDCDVDAAGTIYVADRGANTVLVFSKEGTQIGSVRVNSPISVAALPDGEVAVTTVRDPHLILVFDRNGRDVREFGDPEPLTDREDLNRYASTGMLATDGAGHLYYGFPFLPEPTVRQYDRFGIASQDIAYTNIEALQVAQATRKEIDRQEKRREPPYLKRNLTALAVDRANGDVWLALHTKLLRFDKDGNRRATYLLYLPDGGKLEATSLLVNSHHILVGNDALGVYEFARPDANEKPDAEKSGAASGDTKKTSP